MEVQSRPSMTSAQIAAKPLEAMRVGARSLLCFCIVHLCGEMCRCVCWAPSRERRPSSWTGSHWKCPFFKFVFKPVLFFGGGACRILPRLEGFFPPHFLFNLTIKVYNCFRTNGILPQRNYYYLSPIFFQTIKTVQQKTHQMHIEQPNTKTNFSW